MRRSALAATCTFAAAVLIASGQPLALAPLVLALSVAVATAAAGPGPRRSVVGLLPLGFLVACVSVMTWGLAWGVAGLGGWATRPSAAGGLALLLAACWLVSRRRGGRVQVWGSDGSALAGLLLLLGVGGFVLVTQPIEVWSRVTGSGTDFARHLFHVTELMEAGGMPFGVVGYPRGLHAPAAMVATSLGFEPTMDALWRAMAPLIWLMLSLVLVAVMAAAGRLASLLTPVRSAGPVASVLAGLAFVQMAWFDTFLAFGSIMNIQVGVVLTTLLVVGLQPRVYGSTLGSLTAAVALAVTANAWQLLLPLVGIATLPWIVQWARRGWRRFPDAALWLTGLIVALNGIADQRTRDVGKLVSGATVSDLFRPEWWWWATMGVAGVALLVAFRAGLRTWALSVGGLVAASILTVAGLMKATGSSWDLMLYYPVKALWTAIVVIVPLAAAGSVWAVAHVWRRAGGWNPGAAALGRGLAVLGIGLLVVGVLGRGAAFPPHLQKIAEGHAGYPNWPMAVVDALEDVDLSGRSEAGAIAFGIVPSVPVGAVRSGFVGMVDYMTMESLRFAGIDGDTFSTPFKAALRDRDMTGVCYYLREHPGSLRITGPNPAAGPQWIVDSGCPVDVVDPQSWIVLDLDPVWHRGTPWEVGFGGFPTFAEVESATTNG